MERDLGQLDIVAIKFKYNLYTTMILLFWYIQKQITKQSQNNYENIQDRSLHIAIFIILYLLYVLIFFSNGFKITKYLSESMCGEVF